MAVYSEKELKNILKSKGLRVTRHRLAVFSFLSKVHNPMTVYELLETLRQKNNIDQATVYRNLASLQDAGLIRRLDFNHGHAHYEMQTDKSSNQLICSNCENIERIEGIHIEDVVKKMLKRSKKFKSTTTHGLEIYGLCKSCV